jgi:hypothetical protein
LQGPAAIFTPAFIGRFATCQAYNDSLEAAVTALGTKQDVGGGKITVFSHQSGYWGACIAVRNNTPTAATVIIDCAGSENAVRVYLCSCEVISTYNADAWRHREWMQISSTGSLKSTVTVAARQTEIAHFLMPDKRAPWGWKYTVTYGS